MKRNKRTEVVARELLTPLTRQILAEMGPEGAVIRHRLRRFYRERTLKGMDRSEGEREAPP